MKQPLLWLSCALLGAVLPAYTTQAQSYLDASFGTNGRVFTPFTAAPTTDAATTAVLQPDGKLIVVGQNAAGLEMARYTSTGALDPTFGTGGKVVAPVASPSPSQCTSRISPIPPVTYSACAQADGRIVVVGSVAGNAFVTRFLTDGAADTSFGTNGVSYICGGTVSGYAVRVGQQSTGELLVMVHHVGAGGLANALQPGNPLAYRFRTNGSVDNTYSSSGYNSAYTRMTDGIVEPTGATLWVGFQEGHFINATTTTRQLILARQLANGMLDPAFGTAGIAALSQLDGGSVEGQAVVKTANGQFLVLGKKSVNPSLFLARYNADGTLDASFGTSGTVNLGPITFGPTGENGFTEMALQADGRILLAGTLNGDFALRRLLANGQPDVSYGLNSYVTIHEDVNDQLSDVLVQPDGRAVAVGYTAGTSRQNSRFAVLRVLQSTVLASTSGRGNIAATLRAMPNPVSGETLQIEMDWANAVNSPVAVELLSSVGQVVARTTATVTSSERTRYMAALPTTALRAGLYVLRASSTCGVLMGKVVVQ